MLMTPNDRTAILRYEANGFRVLSPGNHVKCAITGEAITLEALRYWSAVHQEAYASCAIATRRLTGEA